MDPALTRSIAENEDEHWWYEGRRRVLNSILARLDLPPNADILDIGCGAGGNLAVLARHGRLVAVEADAYSRGIAQKREVCDVHAGSLPDDLPFDYNSFHLVTLLDVLEHLEDDVAGLESIFPLLRPGGLLLVMVPSCPFLWSRHDEANQHFRRYTSAALTTALLRAGFTVQWWSHFNTVLFPAIAGIRAMENLRRGPSDNHLSVPVAPLNRLLAGVFGFERHLVGRVRLPFGVSLLALATRPDAR